jgi:hypothetical protein
LIDGKKRGAVGFENRSAKFSVWRKTSDHHAKATVAGAHPRSFRLRSTMLRLDRGASDRELDTAWERIAWFALPRAILPTTNGTWSST